MCGISGIVAFEQAERFEGNVRSMNDALAHRGPDAEGIWHTHDVLLGHRRLAIIDTSSAGNQPMVGNNGKHVLVFNGEIYNFRELRSQLSDYTFRTGTDTEVILAAYNRWGTNCLEHFYGMFAFAIWDNTKNELFMARDRLGIKPVYYYFDNEKFIFSSEIRSILASKLVARKTNQDALVDYLRYQTVHAPDTIIDGVKMLMPGQYMIVQQLKKAESLDDDDKNQSENSITETKNFRITTHTYWQLGKSSTIALSPLGKSVNEIHGDVLELVTQAVERRLVADVPFGAFLSGGIDSSVIVGLMVSILNKPINTFSVTFHEKTYSESKYSQLIAKRFNCNHTEIKLKPNDFIHMLPGALESMDHPSGDGPNTWVVSKVTKDAGITMALSGLGGDELFAGYEVFKRMKHLYRLRGVTYLPARLRSFPWQILEGFSHSASYVKAKQLMGLRSWQLQDTYPIAREVLSDAQILNLLKCSALPANRVESIVKKLNLSDRRSHFLSMVSEAEISTYMQNVLLRDTDQMSMAHALEVRVPFMDHALVEYILQVPDHKKYPHTPKQLLIDSMMGILPKEISNRPKMGFTIPWDHWMRLELKSFCEGRIHLLGRCEYFDDKGPKQLWERFLNHDPLITWSRIWPLVALSNWMTINNVS